MSYQSRDWKTWIKTYKHGALLIEPPEPLFSEVNQLREDFGCSSSRTAHAHITVTHPFIKKPSKQDLETIQKTLESFQPFDIKIGPAVASPKGELLWFKVSPEEPILQLRQALHQLGLFNLELPFTDGFIPHMTISEQARNQEEMTDSLKKINTKHHPMNLEVREIQWSAPDKNLHFRIVRRFPLGAVFT